MGYRHASDLNHIKLFRLPLSMNRRIYLYLSATVHAGHHGILLDHTKRGQSLPLPRCHRYVPLNPFESTDGSRVSFNSTAG